MKSRNMLAPALLLAALGLAACGGHKEVVGTPSGITSPEAPGEKMLWSSSPSRPDWTLKEPGLAGDSRYFVGLSGNFATENLARDDALRNAATRAVSYMGILAKDKFERARVSFGLASTVVDPTEAARQFERQVAANVARELQPKEWYLEQWQLPTGNAWKAFVLAEVPTKSLGEMFRRTAAENMTKAQEDAKAAATEAAKKQAEDAAAFWEKMQEQGLTE